MPKLHVECRVALSPEAAFAAFTDFSRTAERIPDIVAFEVLTEGPPGVGTKIRETRKMFGKEHSEEFEVAHWAPPREFAPSSESCGARWEFIHRFEQEDQGTRISIDGDVRSTSWLATLMAPLGWMMLGSMRKCMQSDLVAAAAALEAETAA